MEEATITTPASKKNWILLGAVVLILLALVFWWGRNAAFSYYYQNGVSALNSGDYAAAKPLFEKSLRFSPKRPEPYARLGFVAMGPYVRGQMFPEADYDQAVDRFERALSLGLKERDQNLYFRSLEHAGLSYRDLRKRDKANEKFLLSIAEEKLAMGGISLLGRLSVGFDYVNRLNRPQEALELLLPAAVSVENLRGLNVPLSLEADTHLLRTYTLISRLYFYFQDWENAERYAKLAREIPETLWIEKDEHLQIAYALSGVLSGKSGNFTEAKQAIKKADELAGSERHGCVLARAYFFGKNYQQAVKTALVEAPKTTVPILTHLCLQVLGSSYEALGNKPEAKRYFNEYLNFTENMEPKDIFVIRFREEAERALEKLK